MENEIKNILAITHYQHPLTGSSEPITLEVTEQTTVKEILCWYKEIHSDNDEVCDLRLIR